MTTTRELWKATAPTAGEQHPADDDYVPPVTTVKLPSRGRAYSAESPLYLCETIDIKPMTAKEENILASPALIKKGTVLTELMRACITNRTIDPNSMLVGDRNAVLTAIRISAYGPQYSANVVCPDCGAEAQHDFDLSRLSLKTLDEEPVGGPGNNEFQFKLPISGRRVTFKLLDANGVQRLEKDLEGIRKNTGREQGVTGRLMAQVVSMEGVKQEHFARAIENLPAQDSRAWRNYMDKIAPGVDMEQMYECQECGSSKEVEIPLGPEFFWPSES